MSDLHPEFLTDYQLYSIRLKDDLAPEISVALESEFERRKWSESEEKAMHDRWHRSEERRWNGKLRLWEYLWLPFYLLFALTLQYWIFIVIFEKPNLRFHETQRWAYRWKVIHVLLLFWILVVCAIALFGDWEDSNWVPPNANVQ